MADSNSLSAWQTFWQMSGAAFVLLLLLTLLIQAVLVLTPLKWLQLRRVLKRERLFELDLEDSRSPDDLVRLVQAHRDAPGARVLARLLSSTAASEASYEALLGQARRWINEEQKQCSRYMATLGSIASVAPLLGLFGTVWGIIEAFLTISAEKSSELPVIAPAMSGALLTTALGLMAAMPASVVYNFANTVIDDLVQDLDTLAQSWAGRLYRDRVVP